MYVLDDKSSGPRFVVTSPHAGRQDDDNEDGRLQQRQTDQTAQGVLDIVTSIRSAKVLLILSAVEKTKKRKQNQLE